MSSFISAFLLLCLFFAGLILFPYKKVYQLLKEHIHLRTFCAGILLIGYGFIFDGKQASVPSANELSSILSQHTASIHPIIIAAGFICLVASFFVNRLFSENK
ncbi:hypothetical protein SPM35_23160 [Enterobacter hormaechei subsp. xiangfangensis]